MGSSTHGKNDVKQKGKTMTQVLHGERLRQRTSDERNWNCLGDSAVGAKYVGVNIQNGLNLQMINCNPFVGYDKPE